MSVSAKDTSTEENRNEVEVENSAELRSALSNATGGETIILTNTIEKYKVTLWQKELSSLPEPVTIRSLDPANPATIDQLILENYGNAVIENVIFSGEPRTSHNKPDLILKKCSDITVKNCTFENSSTEFAERGAAINAAISLAGCDDVTIKDCEISHYLRAISHVNNTNLTISGNHIHHIQEDGIRGGGVDGMVISGNVFEDWLGIDGGWLHSDFIQFWTSSTNILTQNIHIVGNIFHGMPENSPRQVIFARNEKSEVSAENAQTWKFRSWTIEDNVIDSLSPAGIKLSFMEDFHICNNSLLGNSRIQIFQSAEGHIENNIARDVSLSNSSAILEVGNFITQDTIPSRPSYEETVFSGLSVFRESGDVRQLVLSQSFIDNFGQGVGADVSTLPMTARDVTLVIDESGFSFDAPRVRKLSVSAFDVLGEPMSLSDHYVTWSLSDGRTFTGSSVIVDFGDVLSSDVTVTVTVRDGADLVGTGAVTIDHPPRLLFELAATEQGLTDVSGNAGAVISDSDIAVFDPDLGRQVLVIPDPGNVQIDPSFDMSDMPYMTVALTFQRQQTEDGAGTLIGKSKWFRVDVLDDGSIRLIVTNPNTNEQIYLSSEVGLVSNTDWHHMVVVMDHLNDDSAKLYLDGALLIDFHMPWEAATNDSGISLGNRWSKSLDAKVGDLQIISAASNAQDVAQMYDEAILPAGTPTSGYYPDVTPVFDLEIDASGIYDDVGTGSSFSYDADTIVFEDMLGTHVLALPQTGSIKVKSAADLGGVTEMSLELLFRRDAIDGQNGHVVGKSQWFQINLRDNDELHFKLIDHETGKHYDVFTTDVDLNDTAWHHLFVTIDTTGDEAARLYLDGQLEAEIATSTAFRSTDTAFSMGNRFGKTMDGSVGDMLVYDEAFDADYIASAYDDFLTRGFSETALYQMA